MKILVRGSGDIASAAALRLWQAGQTVFLHEEPLPTVTRRGMAFADAAFDGEAWLDGVPARRVEALPDQASPLLYLPLLLGEFPRWLNLLAPDVLIDARMRKHQQPEAALGLAPLTIGLGPGFVAGETVDLAVETAWGESLGQVIQRGSPLALAGEPAALGGHARERYVYAPAAGIFRTTRRIGDLVTAGEPIAWLDGLALQAPLSGALRGLTHDGVPVRQKTKVIEVDPRGNPALVFGVGTRPERIAQGVLQAVTRGKNSFQANNP